MKARYSNPKTEKDRRNRELNFVLTAVAMVLHDKYGEDKDAIHKALSQITYYFDSFGQGYLSVDDAQKTLYEEAGVVIK